MTQHTPTQVLDTIALEQATLVSIVGSRPQFWGLKAQTIGPIRFSSGVQEHEPTVADIRDVVKDDSGFTRGAFSLLVDQPYTISSPGFPRYPSLAEALRAHVFVGATVSVSSYVVSGGGDQSETLWSGKIVQVGQVTSLTATFHVELRREIQEKRVPEVVLERTALDTDTKKNRIPAHNEGEPLPSPLGRARTWLPSWYNLTDGEIHLLLNRSGIPPVVFSCLEVQRETTERKVVFAETASSGLGVDTSVTTNRHDSYVYIRSLGAYARFWEDQPNGVLNYARANTPWDGKGYYLQINHAPYVQASFVASAVDDAESVGLNDGEFAIDEKSETFAVLTPTVNTTEGGVWDIPTISQPGRISQNTNLSYPTHDPNRDFEGPRAPAGITAFACIVVPPGFTPPIGFVRIGLIWPDSSDWVFNAVGAKDFTALDLFPGRAYRLSVPMPVAGPAGQVQDLGTGWSGTKWETGDFSASSVPDGPDRSVSRRGVAGDSGDQVRLRVVNNSDQNIAIVSVGLEVSFRNHWKTSEGRIDLNPIPTRIIQRNGKKQVVVNPSDLTSRNPGRDSTVPRAIFTPPPPAYIDDVYTSQNSYRDNGLGEFTGTADKLLENPADWVRYRLDTYGGQSPRNSGHGSFDDARDLLESWHTLCGGSGLFTGAIHEPNTRLSVEEEVEAIQGEYPLAVLRDEGGVWGAHVWIPRQSDWPTDSYYRETGVIDPISELVQGAEGPAFYWELADSSELVNEIQVNYDYDKGARRFRRTAKCSIDGEDDGYGGRWPVAPGSGVSATDLCGWSRSQFGQLGTVEINLHGVYSPYVALVVGAPVLWSRYRLPVRCFLTGHHTISEIQPRNVFRVGNDLENLFNSTPWFRPEGTDWESVYWLAKSVELRSERNDENRIEITVDVRAEWYPTAIGDEVSAGRGGSIDVGGIFGIGGLEENPS